MSSSGPLAGQSRSSSGDDDEPTSGAAASVEDVESVDDVEDVDGPGYEPLPEPPPAEDLPPAEDPPPIEARHASGDWERPGWSLPDWMRPPWTRPKWVGSGWVGGSALVDGRVQGRVVTERLRHVDPLSLVKVAATFYACAAVVVLLAVSLLWGLARSTGTVDDVEGFVTQLFTYGNCVPEEDLRPDQDFRSDDSCPEGHVMVGSFVVNDGAVLRSTVLGGAILVVVATVGTVMLALLFNLLSELTGGVRYRVVREPLDTGSGSTEGQGRR